MLAITEKQELQGNNYCFVEEKVASQAKISDWITQNSAEAYFSSLNIPVHCTVHFSAQQYRVKCAFGTRGEAAKWTETFNTYPVF